MRCGSIAADPTPGKKKTSSLQQSLMKAVSMTLIPYNTITPRIFYEKLKRMMKRGEDHPAKMIRFFFQK